MAFQLVSEATSKSICDALTERALSIKADGVAIATPGDGGILIDGYDRTNSLQRHLEVSPTGSLGTLQSRASGYWKSVNGRSFHASNPTVGTVLTAQATFAATTPALMLRNAAAAVRAITRSLYVVIASATTADVNIAIVLDTADRLSAGGSAITPRNTNGVSAVATAITAYLANATASAAGAGTRAIFQGRIPKGSANYISLNFDDDAIVALTGSLLVYLWDSAGLAAPDYFFTHDYEESA